MTIAAALALAACVPSDAARDSIHAGLGSFEIQERAVSSTQILGEWRVVAIDRKLLPGGHGIGILIVDDGILVHGGGGSPPLRYGINGLAFRTCKSPNHVPPSEIIAIGYPPRFGDVYRILEKAEQIEITFGKGLKITGGGKSITLFRE